jgi:excisionase family DNA binding protein
MLLNRKQCAKKLGVSERTINRWTKDRKIPYNNLNGIIRFDEEKIDNWLRMKEVRMRSIA